MGGDELPMYPTPQQAAYVTNPSSSGSRVQSSHHGPQKAYRPSNNHESHMNHYSSQPALVNHQKGYHQVPLEPQQYYQQPQPLTGPAVQSYHVPQHQYYQSAPIAPANIAPQPPPQHPSQKYYRSYNAHPQGAPTPPQSQSQVQPVRQQPLPPISSQNSHVNYSRPEMVAQQPRHGSQPQYGAISEGVSNSHKKPPPVYDSNYTKQSKSKDSLPDRMSPKQKLENELKSVFDKVDTNSNGKISARELSLALLNFDHTRFKDSTISLMIKLFGGGSSKGSKSINFDQFVSLWKYLSAYKKLFIQADSNKSGNISFGEFQKVIEQIGYKLDVDLVLHLFSRFSYKDLDGQYDGASVGKLKFDAFIELLVYLRNLTDVFKRYDKDLSGVATINFSDFLFEVSNLS